ncbi:MAG TPA: ATPase [Bacteroidales bacterium]|nr:ATPase [Bacteroidales bacterium]
MLIVAESGSTKIDWRIIKNDKSHQHFTTEGFNPNYHPKELFTGFVARLNEHIQITSAERVFFYGSGCSSLQAEDIIKSALREVIPNAIIEVNHDLFGAARALFGTGSGIASILGTGSSSCIFENGKIVDAVPSLGYLLADEGSGFHLGKLLLNAFFKNDLTEELSEKFLLNYPISLADFLSKLYKHPKPNTLVAEFVPFMVENRNHPVIDHLVRQAFEEFFRNILLKYSHRRNYELGFVGSIAWIFRQQLSEVAQQHQLTIRKIIQNPVNELVKYHLSF